MAEQRFIDELWLELSSGDGGAGCVSFRREKFLPRGGPDGGDGGKGGDVFFMAAANVKTLMHLSGHRYFKAGHGQGGMGKKCHGADGEDVVIKVPPGTVIRDFETNEILQDLAHENQAPWLCLSGGRGGQGNWHFRTSRRQAPEFAQPGEPGTTCKVFLELRLIADIGFVGFPNAGKSSLLAAITHASPKIADYPFTTKTPNLGALRISHRDIILVDIPGIIEGASHGSGLGFRFLKHMMRSRILAFVVDLSAKNPESDFEILLSELRNYNDVFLQKPRLIIGTKLDLEGSSEALTRFRKVYPEETVIGVSVFSREGLESLKENFNRKVKE